MPAHEHNRRCEEPGQIEARLKGRNHIHENLKDANKEYSWKESS